MDTAVDVRCARGSGGGGGANSVVYNTMTVEKRKKQDLVDRFTLPFVPTPHIRACLGS